VNHSDTEKNSITQTTHNKATLV